eukprot:g3107.t1
MAQQQQNKGQIMTPAIEAEAKILQALENEITGMQTKQQTLTSQLNENSMVKQEMDLLNEDSKVYKLVGPVLVLQDFVMAKDNVEKRLEYIQKDMKRVDEAISKKSKEAGEIQQKIVKMQKDEVERLKSLQAN